MIRVLSRELRARDVRDNKSGGKNRHLRYVRYSHSMSERYPVELIALLNLNTLDHRHIESMCSHCGSLVGEISAYKWRRREASRS